MTTYAYEPLDYGKAQTRMIHLYPAPDYSDAIRISLKTVTLPRSCLNAPLKSDPEAKDLISEGPDVETPEFIALSYVWGSPDDPQEVFVESAPDGACSISITRNLDTALRHIRMRPKHETIWIDAICIDQGNIKERSHQVAFMDSIYTIARGTLVWLGPGEHDSEKALLILSYLGRRVVQNSNGNIERHPDAPPRKPDEPVWEETQAGDTISVILGCQLPIVLRKDPASSADPDETRWKVVGACYANGLMSGEAVYGSLPSYYHPLENSKEKDEELICYKDCALLDRRTNDLKTDPSAVLKEFGIQPSAWSREPHQLEVSEPVLRAAGVDLRNFILV